MTLVGVSRSLSPHPLGSHPLFGGENYEYRIDDPRFICIGEKARQISLNGVGSKGKKVERLYRVKGGIE